MNQFFLMCLAIVIAFLWVLLSLLLQRYGHILTCIHSCKHISQTKIEKDGMGGKKKSGRQNSENFGKIPRTAGHTLYLPLSLAVGRAHQQDGMSLP